jgi:2-C-methyl-D-erythritol 4-phosphate cytidylyltransferase/2-C-methyl-D-erythritol 2,4-cyclodiphosphate synthase
MRDVLVVLVAAGSGTRLGAGIPKALVNLAGKPLFEHALQNIVALPNLLQVVIAVPAGHHGDFESVADRFSSEHFTIRLVTGGETRQESIANALAAAQQGHSITLVHDAARAMASTALFERVATAVRESGAGVLPVLPVVDTIKLANAEQIIDTVDRTHLRIAQTPQGFPSVELAGAYAEAAQQPEIEYTDDSSLYGASGRAIISVIGENKAFKVTTQADLAAAEQHFQSTLRTGIGTDVHRFTADGRKPLILAGIEWPNEVALEGHSDGDAVAHAVVDALLAAAGLGDIGGNFGVDRPEYAGASGEVFIRGTLELLASHGWRVQNVSVQLIGNRPKVAPMREAAQARMTELVGAPVTIGATTTDGLGFLGNSEGVAAVATALIAGSAK